MVVKVVVGSSAPFSVKSLNWKKFINNISMSFNQPQLTVDGEVNVAQCGFAWGMRQRQGQQGPSQSQQIIVFKDD